MLGAFMAVLDIQITNSSLKDIQGALSATLEKARGFPPPTWSRKSS
jgi:DHA2 family multidrug resistance protein